MKHQRMLISDFFNDLAGSTDFGNVSFVVPGIHPFFYICTDALNHTEEYTAAAGKAARVCWEKMLFHLTKLHCIRRSDNLSRFPGHLVCLLSFYLLDASFFLLRSSSCARSWKGPVVHPEDSQSSGYDSCGCSVLPCSAEASERGLQAGQTQTGEMTGRQRCSRHSAVKTMTLITVVK